MPIIEKWIGRVGNNILQIIRCIHYAIKHNHSYILFPSHRYLGVNKITINSNNTPSHISGTFFYLKKLGLQDPPPHQMKLYFKKYVKPVMKLNFKETPGNNVLHIHIRGGDIFSPSGGHPFYVQPPLQYYIDIIKSKKWEKIIVVHEDRRNPCVDALSGIENLEFQSSTLTDDLEQLCQATNLVVGFGTYGYLIYLMNDNLKNMYIPAYALEELPQGDWGDVSINAVELPNYIRCGEWKNTREQCQIMLNYR